MTVCRKSHSLHIVIKWHTHAQCDDNKFVNCPEKLGHENNITFYCAFVFFLLTIFFTCSTIYYVCCLQPQLARYVSPFLAHCKPVTAMGVGMTGHSLILTQSASCESWNAEVLNATASSRFSRYAGSQVLSSNVGQSHCLPVLSNSIVYLFSQRMCMTTLLC